MRILHINCNYIGTTLHQLMIEHLDALGIQNEVFVPTYDKNIAVIKPNNNVYVSECFNKWDRLVFDYKQRKIIKAIEEHYDVASFDLIHAYTLYTDGNVARVLSEKYGVPFVVAVRNTDVNDFLKKMIHLRKRGLKTLLAAKAVFFLSEAYKKTVIEKYTPHQHTESIMKKTKIIPNGIDSYWFDNIGNNRNYDRIQERLNHKQLKLIYVGCIDKNKNITTTCDAIDILKEDGWNIEFTVVGAIKDKTVFSSIKDKIKYLPARPKEELLKCYRDADIFVMPSIHETFGLVYVEALSQGLPIIYSEKQGFDEQFENGYVGYHVDAMSPKSISNAMCQIAYDYTKFSNVCLEASKQFDWYLISKSYLDIYYSIVCAKKKKYSVKVRENYCGLEYSIFLLLCYCNRNNNIFNKTR